MIEKPLPDLLTLSTTLYDDSVLCNRFLKARKAQIWAGGNAGVKRKPKLSGSDGLNIFKIYFFNTMKISQDHLRMQEQAQAEFLRRREEIENLEISSRDDLGDYSTRKTVFGINSA